MGGLARLSTRRRRSSRMQNTSSPGSQQQWHHQHQQQPALRPRPLPTPTLPCMETDLGQAVPTMPNQQQLKELLTGYITRVSSGSARTASTCYAAYAVRNPLGRGTAATTIHPAEAVRMHGSTTHRACMVLYAFLCQQSRADGSAAGIHATVYPLLCMRTGADRAASKHYTPLKRCCLQPKLALQHQLGANTAGVRPGVE